MTSQFFKKLLLQRSVRYYSESYAETLRSSFGSVCRKFAEEELMPIASKLDKNGSFPSEQIQKLGSLGMMGILVPTEYGGAGLNTSALFVTVEEISRGCAGTGAIVSIHNALYADVLNRYGTAHQKQRFLPNFVNGNCVGSFALSESDAGSDAASLMTTATPTDSGWILNGSKAWVTSAREAKAVIVFASTDQKKRHRGISAFVVEIPTQGLSVGRNEDKLGIRASSTCSISFHNVYVTKESLIGEEGGGFKIAMSSLDCARIGIASQAVGIAQASLDCAVEYANKRKAFGNPIIHLQAVQHRIARMATQLEAARTMTRSAACLRDQNRPFTKEASMAKLVASEAATSVSHNCIQILGGMGYVTDMPAERHYRDARITEIYAGVTDIQLLVIAERVAEEYGYKIR